MKAKEFLKEKGIDIDSSLEYLGDMEMYNETLNDFLEEIDEKMQKLATYQSENDMENYAIVVHALKGEAKYLGFTSLADIALNLQLKSQENDSSYVAKFHESLVQEVKKIKDIISSYLN